MTSVLVIWTLRQFIGVIKSRVGHPTIHHVFGHERISTGLLHGDCHLKHPNARNVLATSNLRYRWLIISHATSLM